MTKILILLLALFITSIVVVASLGGELVRDKIMATTIIFAVAAGMAVLEHVFGDER